MTQVYREGKAGAESGLIQALLRNLLAHLNHDITLNLALSMNWGGRFCGCPCNKSPTTYILIPQHSARTELFSDNLQLSRYDVAGEKVGESHEDPEHRSKGLKLHQSLPPWVGGWDLEQPGPWNALAVAASQVKMRFSCGTANGAVAFALESNDVLRIQVAAEQ